MFRPGSKGGRVGGDGFVRALKDRAASAGLDAAGFSGYSLRAGFLLGTCEWWLAGDARPWQPDGMSVVSDRLVFRPRPKLVA